MKLRFRSLVYGIEYCLLFLPFSCSVLFKVPSCGDILILRMLLMVIACKFEKLFRVDMFFMF
uniref:Uncharacterized protein n=1 Tax=Rhizophora mucronata TaxID=61149 RepID=A0A2P2KLL3_RHIMU